jgi:NAD(P)-dependent dehydrogenase (short-subunit alcohol dehydrogenase family)
MGSLNGHRAVVTGGGSGIGAETCRRMAAEGADVSVFDLNGANAQSVADEIDGLAYAVDVTDYDGLAAAMRDASQRMGGLTLLFNNAGGSTLSPIHDFDVSEWNRIVTLNLTGVFHGFKAAAPLILESGGGAIVSTASISGTRPAAGEAPYSAAKAAVVALTASAALEYAPNIRVNSVSPA